MGHIKIHKSKCRAKWGREGRRTIHQQDGFSPNGSGNKDYSWLLGVMVIVLLGIIVLFIW